MKKHCDLETHVRSLKSLEMTPFDKTAYDFIIFICGPTRSIVTLVLSCTGSEIKCDIATNLQLQPRVVLVEASYGFII